MRCVLLAFLLFSTAVYTTKEEKGNTKKNSKSNVCFYCLKGLKPLDKSQLTSIKDIKDANEDIKIKGSDIEDAPKVGDAESVSNIKSKVKRFNDEKRSSGDHVKKTNKNLKIKSYKKKKKQNTKKSKKKNKKKVKKNKNKNKTKNKYKIKNTNKKKNKNKTKNKTKNKNKNKNKNKQTTSTCSASQANKTCMEAALTGMRFEGNILGNIFNVSFI